MTISIKTITLKITRNKLKLVLVLGILLVSFLIVYRLFFLHLIRVPTGSMANTVIPGDHLVVKKRAFGEIKRGDLIVFRYPHDNATYYLARVVGLPQETIEVRRRSVYINGQELGEQRVLVKSDDLFDADSLEELSTEGSGPYRVFFSDSEQDLLGLPLDYPFGSVGDLEYQIMSIL